MRIFEKFKKKPRVTPIVTTCNHKHGCTRFHKRMPTVHAHMDGRTHGQSHTNSTQAYHHSPSSHNQNNLAKKRGVEASKQDPGKDDIADLLPTQPIVFWWFIIIWRQKEINQTFPLVFLIIVIIIIILISMISILVTTIAIIIMIIIIIITWYRRRWH